MMDYIVVIKKLSEDDGGGYLASVPDLYGCMSDGATPEEAMTNVKDAVADWIEVAMEAGREVPVPGSAAKRARAREASLLGTIKVLSENYEELDGRIEQVVRELESVKELIESQDSWTRFEAIAAVGPNHTAKLLMHC